MDHRVVPEHFFQLNTNGGPDLRQWQVITNVSSEVPVFRNAGGRAHRAVLDAAVLDVLTTVAEVLVIHHTSG